MLIPSTPTDPRHRQSLIPPSLLVLEDWDLQDLQPGEVDWLGWRPEIVETLFKDADPEGLFFHRILETDRLSSRWSKIVGSDRSVWLHALVDAANEHPKSALLREAMDHLAPRIAPPGQDPLNSGGDNWGDDGIAERVLLHLMMHHRSTPNGAGVPIPRHLKRCLAEMENDIGPLERLDASGHASPAESRMLLGMAPKPAQAEPLARQLRR